MDQNDRYTTSTDEPDFEDHTRIAVFFPTDASYSPTAHQYYAYCYSERRRIGGYENDIQVVIRRAEEHSRKNRHRTGVFRK